MFLLRGPSHCLARGAAGGWVDRAEHLVTGKAAVTSQATLGAKDMA